VSSIETPPSTLDSTSKPDQLYRLSRQKRLAGDNSLSDQRRSLIASSKHPSCIAVKSSVMGEQDLPAVLQRPLYLFDLPKELLDSLTVKGQQPEQQTSRIEVRSETPSSIVGDEKPETAKATSCALCGLTFASLEDQRLHVKSDLHGYNLKQKLRGLPPVTDAHFEKLIGELDESISGSDSDDSESEDDVVDSKDGLLAALLKKQAKISDASKDTANSTSQPTTEKSPLLWLVSPILPDNFSLGVYTALFPSVNQVDIVEAIRKKQLSPISPSSKSKSQQAAAALQQAPSYFLCMIGGGHFAAMVVSLTPKLVSKHSGRVERDAVVLAHKTFHRYTTRRKQGGSQSASDGAKGAAHSAGSSLRRANETALTAEVRALLTSWKSMIDSSELIFIRSNGKTNHKTLFGQYEGQSFTAKDPRIRSFPFSTRRATQSELIRAFTELTRVKISQVDQAKLDAAAREQAAKELSTPKVKKPTPVVKLDPEEEALIMHTTQISSLIKRAKAPALLTYAHKNKLDLSTFTLHPESQHHHAPTPLHLAASLGAVPIITSLLMKLNVDPTIKNADEKTAYAIAKDRASRDTFRTARFALGEGKWPWDEAGVGSAMSPKEAQEREAKEREEEALEAAKESDRRKAEVERLRRSDVEQENARQEKKHGKGNVLGQETAASRREQEARGLTPEMRARLERERRARAAEERLRRIQDGG
jgi:Bacteroidetes VLRF1 release factor